MLLSPDNNPVLAGYQVTKDALGGALSSEKLTIGGRKWKLRRGKGDDEGKAMLLLFACPEQVQQITSPTILYMACAVVNHLQLGVACTSQNQGQQDPLSQSSREPSVADLHKLNESGLCCRRKESERGQDRRPEGSDRGCDWICQRGAPYSAGAT